MVGCGAWPFEELRSEMFTDTVLENARVDYPTLILRASNRNRANSMRMLLGAYCTSNCAGGETGGEADETKVDTGPAVAVGLCLGRGAGHRRERCRTGENSTIVGGDFGRWVTPGLHHRGRPARRQSAQLAEVSEGRDLCGRGHGRGSHGDLPEPHD